MSMGLPLLSVASPLSHCIICSFSFTYVSFVNSGYLGNLAFLLWLVNMYHIRCYGNTVRGHLTPTFFSGDKEILFDPIFLCIS